MNTLCIPVGREHQNLRMQTIHNMALIYAIAHSVLILDASLMSLSSTDQFRNLVSYILCYAWIRA